MSSMASDDKLPRLEIDVATIKGSLDWAKIVVSVVSAVALGSAAIIIAIVLNVSGKVDRLEAKLDDRIDNLTASVESINARLSDEFRAQRADSAAQIAAITGAITATKSVQPQVVVVPAPGAPDRQP